VAEPSWSEGYVVDLDYTRGYFRELSPTQLRFVALLAGLEAPGAEEPFNYCELGCGNGYSTALHATANPLGRFVGVDFNPTHIRTAQKLGQDAGLDNAHFLEKSFAELLEEKVEDADFVVLHGVWSWVGDEPREQLLEFMRRRLKPAGMVYLSYNCLPGLAQVAPLQRLLNEHASLGAGDRIEKVRRSMEFAAGLQKAGARFFTVNPLAGARLADMGRHDPHYLAHEYYNANWSPFYHADVARELAGAKLAYAGSAALLDNFEQFVLTPELAKIVAGIPDRSLAETIKDFARNQGFRRDVYTRGAPKATASLLEATLARTRFALIRPRSACRLRVPTPAGEVTLQAEAYVPVLDALARTPMTFDELARAPECTRLDRVRLRQAVFGMAAFGNVLPGLPATGEDARRERTDRFNRAILSQPVAGSADTVLASPVLGAGLHVNLIDRLFLGAPRDEAQAIAAASAAIAARKLRLRKGTQTLESAADIAAHVKDRAQFFFADFLPFLRLLRVVD
jgi:SAM-dependent methyltransferase